MLQLPSRSLAVAAGLALLALPSAASGKLYVGTPNGTVHTADPLLGNFSFATICGGPVSSMVQIGTDVYLGDVNGGVYVFDLTNGSLVNAFSVSNDATDMLVHDGDLLVSGSDGTILRVDPADGTVLETLTSQFEVQAMALDGDVLYAGTPFGVFEELDLAAVGGSFSFAGVCGGPINSMLWVDDSLFLGDTTGNMYLYDETTGFVSYTFTMPSDAVSLVAEGDDLLVGGSDGVIHRLDRETGAVLDTMTAPAAVGDLLVESELARLSVDVSSLSIATGGVATLELDAVVSAVGDTYFALGSVSGAFPGLDLGGIALPLNPDAYMSLTTLTPNVVLTGSVGTFAPDGSATATFNLPIGVSPSLTGLRIHHAFMTFDSTAGFALGATSNAVGIDLAP